MWRGKRVDFAIELWAKRTGLSDLAIFSKESMNAWDSRFVGVD